MNSSSGYSERLSTLRRFRERLARGEALTARQYADALQIHETDELFVDLVFAEFLEREHRCEENVEQLILEAYPSCADELRLQIELHRSLPSEEPSQDSEALKATRVENPFRLDRLEGNTTLPAIPGFDILAPLGRGGMGIVLLAKELQLDRLVAIKLLLAGELSSADHRRRFRAEARAAAALRHPNIVQVDDIGDVGGQPYIVMEYVAGGTMEDFLRRHRATPRDAAQFIRKIAWAVHAAHQAGIVHRDLKPGNLLLAPRVPAASGSSHASMPAQANDIGSGGAAPSSLLNEYEPKITDFGLAKSLAPLDVNHAALTIKGDVLGTPCYMSPEQARGDAVGPGADIYSMGSILYEMLSGKPPFQRPTPWETIQCVLEQEPPSLASKLPADLRTICEKCLSKDPGQRYPSMAALAVDLGNYLEGRPIDARPVGNLTRLARWARRNVATATSLAVLFLTLSTLLVVLLWSRWSLKDMLEESLIAKRQESMALKSSREQLWDNLLSEAQSIQTSGQIGQRYRSLENVRQAIKMLPLVGETPEREFHLRNQAIAAFPLIDVHRVQIAKLSNRDQEFLSADSRLQRFALRQTDRSIHILDAANGQLLQQIPPVSAELVVLSPDGRHLMINGTECILHSLPDLASKRRLGKNVYRPVFSPDSRQIAGYDSHGFFIHDIQDRRTDRIDDIPIATMPMVFSPDGNRLALVSNDRLIIVTLYPQVSMMELPGPTLSQIGNALAWHPGGDYVVAGLYSDRVITVWHLPTRLPAKTFRVNGNFHNLQFDPSGQYLIKASLWGGTREIYGLEMEASLLSLPNEAGLAFGQDDSKSSLTFNSPSKGSLDAWRLENQVVVQTIEPAQLNNGQRSHCVLSACGRWLLVNSAQGVEIYDAIRGKPAGCLPIGPLTHAGISSLDDSGFAILLKDRIEFWRAESGGLRPTRSYQLSSGFEIIDVSADQRWGIATHEGGIFLVDISDGQPPRLLGPNNDVRSAAFDLIHGRIATASWNFSEGVTVWDMATGKEVKRLSVEPQCVVRFSPDGRYLFTSSGGGRLWDVDSWNDWHLDSPDASGNGFGFAFSPDSRWFTHTSGNGILKIQDLDKRSTHAVLTDPDQHPYFSLAFSADNTSLFGVTMGRDCFVKQWDFGQIDRLLLDLRLAPLELTSHLKHAEPLPYGDRLRVASSPEVDQRVERYVRSRVENAFAEKRWAAGLAELRSAILAMPEHGELLIDLAWRLVTLPPEFQDRTEALAAIERAQKISNSDRIAIVSAMVKIQFMLFEEAFDSLRAYPKANDRRQILVQYLNALLLAELGQQDQAMQAFLSAQQLEYQPVEATTDLPIADWDHFRRMVGAAVFRRQVEPDTKP